MKICLEPFELYNKYLHWNFASYLKSIQITISIFGILAQSENILFTASLVFKPPKNWNKSGSNPLKIFDPGYIEFGKE